MQKIIYRLGLIFTFVVIQSISNSAIAKCTPALTRLCIYCLRSNSLATCLNLGSCTCSTTTPTPEPTPTPTPEPTPTPTSTPTPTTQPCPTGAICTLPEDCPYPNVYKNSSPPCGYYHGEKTIYCCSTPTPTTTPTPTPTPTPCPLDQICTTPENCLPPHSYSSLPCVNSLHCCCPATLAAERIISSLDIMPGSVVAITGPVPPGSVIKGDIPEENGLPAVLNVPADSTGQYFVFFIDDYPNFYYEHPVRYAWYNCKDSTYSVTNANWRMTIYPPNSLSTPYVPQWSDIINGVEVLFGTGEFAGEVFLNPSKPIEGASTTSNNNNINSTVSLDKRNMFEKIAEERLQPLSKAPKCLKEAFVFDMGDKNKWGNHASRFSSDADLMESYLKRMGFNVTRKSNYWGNNLPGIYPSSFLTVLKGFLNNVDTHIRDENQKGAAYSCVKHEVFLYLNGHGGNGVIACFEANGSGEYYLLRYEDLIKSFEKFQKNITFYIFVDACKSGSLITKGNPQKLIDAGKFAVYIITSTSATNDAVGTTLITESGTVDCIDGMKKTDWDKDEKKPDDIGDCFGEMKDDAIIQNDPQRWRSPDVNDSWYYSLELFEPEGVEHKLPVP